MLEDGVKGVIIQRDRETYAVAPHLPCGMVTPDTLRKLADVAEKYKVQAIKVTSAARIALIGIKEEDVDAIWADLGMDVGNVVGICVRSVKACPGTTYCKRGQQDSLAVGLALDKKYHGMEMPGKMKIGVSGCPNQCAETSFKDIGLVGIPKGWRVMWAETAVPILGLGRRWPSESTRSMSLPWSRRSSTTIGPMRSRGSEWAR